LLKLKGGDNVADGFATFVTVADRVEWVCSLGLDLGLVWRLLFGQWKKGLGFS
jgi:hypothetical protein